MEQENGISKGSSVYKVPEGKLIKVWLEVEVPGNILVDIKLTGDFFIHPEEWIASLENELKGMSMDDIPGKIIEQAEKDDVQLVGIGTEDIIHAIKLAFESTGS
ncbi:MAG: hypothetical protein KAS16_05430 [Thermoplasmata archaeon]|nr:hypothetical protein [Thermoplasmata archaeon]